MSKTQREVMKAMMKTGEVARLFGVTNQTIRNWVETGVLRCERTSDGTRLFRMEDISSFLDARNTYKAVRRQRGGAAR